MIFGGGADAGAASDPASAFSPIGASGRYLDVLQVCRVQEGSAVMEPYQPQHDLLTTASHLNRAGRQLVPLLRALPAPMRRTCADLATSLAETAEKRRPCRPGSGRRTPDRRFDRRMRSRLRDKQGRCAGVGADASPARSADGPSGDTRLAGRSARGAGKLLPRAAPVNWRYDKRRRGPRRPVEDLIGPARSRTSPRSIGGQESVETMLLPSRSLSPIGWPAHGPDPGRLIDRARSDRQPRRLAQCRTKFRAWTAT